MRPTLLIVLIALISLAACEVYLAPSSFWSNIFDTKTDSKYYESKAFRLVQKISKEVEEYEINKIAVISLVDEEGNVPILGEYFSNRLIEEITRNRIFRVAQKGEVHDVLNKLQLKPSLLYNKETTKQIGEALQAQAILSGKITDIGTNLDVNLMIIDITTGEVIASATEVLNRTKFAVEMLRHF